MSAHTSAADLLRSLRLLVGAATPAVCRVYVEVDRAERDGGNTAPTKVSDTFSLSGRITGPYCPYAQTLSTTHEFVDCGPGRTLLAEAHVTEACFWTPEFPYLYEVEIKLSRAGEEVATTRKLFGMRWFAAEARTLLCERQPWVLAGLRTKRPIVDDLDSMHESSVAAVLPSPDDATCVLASQVGVLLVAEVAARGEQLAPELARLAQWPAVVFALLPGDVEISPAARRAAGNMLLVQDAEMEESKRGEVAVAPWAQVVMLAMRNNTPLPGPSLSRSVPHFVTFPTSLAQPMPSFHRNIDIWRNRWTTEAGTTHEVLPAGYILDRRMIQ